MGSVMEHSSNLSCMTKAREYCHNSLSEHACYWLLLPALLLSTPILANTYQNPIDSLSSASKISLARTQQTLKTSQQHSKHIMNRLSQWDSEGQRIDFRGFQFKYHNTTLPAGTLLHELAKLTLGSSSFAFKNSSLGHFINGQYHYNEDSQPPILPNEPAFSLTTGFDWKLNTAWLVGIGLHQARALSFFDNKTAFILRESTQLSFFSSYQHQAGFYVNSTILNGISRFNSLQKTRSVLNETSDSKGLEYATNFHIGHKIHITDWQIIPSITFNLTKSYAEDIFFKSFIDDLSPNEVLFYRLSASSRLQQSSLASLYISRFFNIQHYTFTPSINIKWQNSVQDKSYHPQFEYTTANEVNFIHTEEQTLLDDRTHINLMFNLKSDRLQSLYLKTEHELDGDTLHHSALSAGLKFSIP